MKLVLLTLSLVLLALPAGAEVALNSLFADGMVLQRETEVPIWGTADAGTTVTVEFAGQSKVTTADAAGYWNVRLAPLPASSESRVLEVKSASGSMQFRDVLVGDVWLAAGQSNMAYPVISLPDASQVLARADDSQLRFFTVAKKVAAEPQGDLQGKWEASNPITTRGLSAVAYFFAREIRRTQNIPVAVIQASWGGAPIQPWISLAGFRRPPPLAKQLAEWKSALAEHENVKSNPNLATDYLEDLRIWKQEVEPAFNAALKEYDAEVAAGRTDGKRPLPERPDPINPDPMGLPGPSKRPVTPTVIFNGMIAPLVPYALRGFIWYQGESDGGNGLEYRILLPRLITDWRTLWNQEDLPFLFVQLPDYGPDSEPVAKSGWPYLREAQFLTLKVVPHTGMAVTIDVGNPKDIHPARKLPVGQRLSVIARKLAYGEDINASGPVYEDFSVVDGKVKVRFRETGSGLTVGQVPGAAPEAQAPTGDKLIGFFLAGEDKKWYEADATIEGDSVIVSSPAVPHPLAARYGWANSPRCNLYNKEGLPASPFRTDDWR